MRYFISLYAIAPPILMNAPEQHSSSHDHRITDLLHRDGRPVTKRRHQLGHRANRAGNPAAQQNIEVAQVILWFEATNYFGIVVSTGYADKKH